jgi:hypothetical protein
MFSPLRTPHCAFCTFKFDLLFGLSFSSLRTPHCAFCTFKFDLLFGLHFLLLGLPIVHSALSSFILCLDFSFFSCCLARCLSFIYLFIYLFLVVLLWTMLICMVRLCNKRKKLSWKNFVTSTKDIYLISSLWFSEDIAGKQSIMKGCHVVL